MPTAPMVESRYRHESLAFAIPSGSRFTERGAGSEEPGCVAGEVVQGGRRSTVIARKKPVEKVTSVATYGILSVGSCGGEAIMSTVEYAHIAIGPDNVPILAGTRIKVVEIVLDHLAHGSDAQEIHRDSGT